MMKGVVLGIAPRAVLVDLTHEVPPQDVRAGAFLLQSATPYFPAGTIHVAIVDPGVGTNRRALLVETRDAFFLAPDNGLVSLAVAASDVVRLLDVSHSPYRRAVVSRTFHGRDVFAPVAGRLAAGIPPTRLGHSTRSMLRLRVPAVRAIGRQLIGQVLWSDRFGNLITNVRRRDLAAAGAFRSRGVSVTINDHALRLCGSYAAAMAGRAVALVNSSDLLEIAVNRGSAAAVLGAGRGARVTIQPR
jgi:S-adenosylmethionine hydrolase